MDGRSSNNILLVVLLHTTQNNIPEEVVRPPVMPRREIHDRASSEMRLLFMAGVAIVTVVAYAAIKSMVTAFWANPESSVETITSIANGISGFLAAGGAGVVFLVVVLVGILGQLE